MPTVPRLITPQVAPSGLPVPGLSGASPADFGAALGNGLDNAGAALKQFAEVQRDKADTVRLLSFQSQLDALDHTLVVNGALTKQGKDALPIYNDTLQAYDKATTAMIDGLAGTRQKDAAATLVARRRAAIGNTLEAHTSRETQRYAAEVAATAEDSAGNMAISYGTDPTRREKAMQEGEAGIRASGAVLGQAPEVVDARLAKFRSSVHQGVIERLLANNQDQDAAAYLQEYRGQIEGSALARLENAVGDGSTLGEAFRQSDRIIATAKDRGDALDMVRQITDPKVRNAAQTEVNQHFSEQDAVQRERENTNYENAARLLEQNGGSVNRLKVALGGGWLALDVQARAQLEARAAQIQKGPAVQTNDRVYTEFMLKSPAAMAQVNPLRELRPFLDDGDYQRAVALVAEARRGKLDGNDTAHLTDVLEVNAQILSLAGPGGLNLVPADPPSKWSTDQTAQFNALQRTVQARLQAFELGQGGKKASPVDRQRIIDDVARETVSLRASHLGLDFLAKDPTVPVAALTHDQEGRAYVPFETIPAEHATTMGNVLTTIHLKATNANIERLYARWLIESAGIANPQWDVFTKYLADHPGYVREAVK